MSAARAFSGRHAMLAKVHLAAKELALDEDARRDVIERVTGGLRSAGDCTDAQLDAVLADIAARGGTRIVNLGDILSGPLFPGETADRLMAMNLPTIAGNHARQLLTLAPDRMGLSARYAASRLTARHRDWIAALPAQHWLAPDVLMVHGAPGSALV